MNYTVLRVVKPLYGIPDSGLHWYLTYLEHHLVRIGMEISVVDPFALIKRRHNQLIREIILQVDYSFGIGTEEFFQAETEAAKCFQNKPIIILDETPALFNGLTITSTPDVSLYLQQTEKIDKLEVPNCQKGFGSVRALAQYIFVSIIPHVCAPEHQIVPVNAPTTLYEFKSFPKVIKFLRITIDTPLIFKPLYLSSEKLVLVSDA